MKVREQLIRQTIQLAEQARQHGNDPFGALLAIDGQALLTAENTANSEVNPTCHAETNLIQKAIRDLTQEQIARAALYTSCEPCVMCCGTIYWTGIREVVYALPNEELIKISGSGFAVSCHELFKCASDNIEAAGPFLIEEALKPHDGYWT